MIALPPLNLNIILQISSYSSYCIPIVSRQKQSILVVQSGNLFTNNHNSCLVLHKHILINIIITILAADILKKLPVARLCSARKVWGHLGLFEKKNKKPPLLPKLFV